MDKEKLSERKLKILKAVVEEYIRSATPISSGEIQRKHFQEISSATIRAELSTLEDMGYLIQPHTSAGRTPSKKAYKLYVERFIGRPNLPKNEIELINNSFKERFVEVEDIVKKTAKIITDITNYTSVIILKNINTVKLKEIKLVDLDEHTALVIIITDSGIIRDKVITLSYNISPAYIVDANAVINKVFSGKSVSQIKKLSEGSVDEEIEEYKELLTCIVTILNNFSENSQDNVYMEGTSKMLEYTENDVETTRGLLSIVDSKEKVASIIEDEGDIEFSVKIGKEEGLGVDKCAVVTAKYMLNGKEIGHAGVIGPERMDYSKVVSVLRYIVKALDEINGDGGSNGKKRLD